VITRRELLIAGSAGLFLLAAPLASLAQQQGKVWRIGLLRVAPFTATDSHTRDALLQGLRELGYVEGKNFAIEYRFADGKLERLPALAAELVRLKVDVILSLGTVSTLAAQKATATIPIVMANVPDPVASGIVKGLARPGGNVTGLTDVTGELGPKNLEILRGMAPRLARVAVLFDPNNPSSILILKSIQVAAQSAGVVILPAQARSAQEIEDAFSTMKRENAGAVFVAGGNFFTQQIRQIADLALKHRLLSASMNTPHANAGVLTGYGSNFADNYRRMAYYVDRILKGARAGDLPIEQPTRFELVINLKTAKALGITVPQELLLRADRVIE
jgi:putative ABC transport system substrate-binding protein